jgi:hypothetical protein
MQRILNNPDQVVDEMLQGFFKVHADIVEPIDNPRVVKARRVVPGKVGIVTGGGSGCELYRRAIEAGQLDLIRRIRSSSRFRFIELDPLGAKFPQFGTEIGGRLTVAIGLTEDAENIARVVPHRDIEPITRTVKERIDHTELYGDG